ncbi:hypothetical protein D9757_010014 [Collybiopsis confluens]|uniref:Uncharacterized protein n=1 Tax=Collybiopsis confluens TaxID=2823264 RepID=A0A8H5GV83_9AGAR|nr:hypothetical protein D9757_010014 [Collybiopsis confluens]
MNHYAVTPGDFLYGGRPIVYALLAASDPALVRGLKTLYRVNRGIYGPYPDHIEEHSTDSDESRRSRGLIVHIELSTIRDTEPSTHISKLPGAPTVIKADTKDKDPGVEVTENLNTALPQNTEGEVTRVEGAGSRSRTRGRNYRESLGSSASMVLG